MAKSIPYAERKFDRKHSQEYNNEYKREHYDRIGFLAPKGMKEQIKEAAEVEGCSMSEWINKAIDERLNK